MKVRPYGKITNSMARGKFRRAKIMNSMGRGTRNNPMLDF